MGEIENRIKNDGLPIENILAWELLFNLWGERDRYWRCCAGSKEEVTSHGENEDENEKVIPY